MGLLVTAIFLIVYSLATLFNRPISNILLGLLALIAGILLLVEVGLPHVRRIQ